MKLLKYLIVFAAGVIFTLVETGYMPTLPRLPIPTNADLKFGGDSAAGVVTLIA